MEILTNYQMSDIIHLTLESMQTYIIDIRPRRQTTLPQSLLKEVGVTVGDKLLASVKEKKIILKAQKNIALDALGEIQRIVRDSDIPVKHIQKNATRIRKEIYAERYSKGIS